MHDVQSLEHEVSWYAGMRHSNVDVVFTVNDLFLGGIIFHVLTVHQIGWLVLWLPCWSHYNFLVHSLDWAKSRWILKKQDKFCTSSHFRRQWQRSRLRMQFLPRKIGSVVSPKANKKNSRRHDSHREKQSRAKRANTHWSKAGWCLKPRWCS